jgi:peptidoglycan biosynthesis protein MviN/MurJ (putative lipid II flippase)
MWNYILHFGVEPTGNLNLICPDPAPGQAAAPPGLYDPASIAAAFDHVALASVIAVLLCVLLCYQLTKASLGPRFVKQWWLWLLGSAAACAVVALVVLKLAHTTAYPGSCSTNPLPFDAPLPEGLVMLRTAIGFVWGPVAFFFMSLVLTRTVGQVPSAKNGFFHNRGCPVPRVTP